MSSKDSTPPHRSRNSEYDSSAWQSEQRQFTVASPRNDQEVQLIQSQPYHRFQLEDLKSGQVHSTETITPASAWHSTAAPTPSVLRDTLTSWALEILAVAVSIASIIAIITILQRENGRPLAAWKLAVSLNTVIATLGTIARTTLAFAISACVGQQKWSWFRRKSDRLVAFERFDEASRGPYGGAKLFFWLRLRHWAALGAFVTIGVVAFDPFLQAVISTIGRSSDVSATQNATIGHALKLDGGHAIRWSRTAGSQLVQTTQGYLSPQASLNRPDFGIVSALYSGFSNSSLYRSESADFQCVTGNCTWSPFISAAVCSRCEDVSTHLTSTSGYGTDGSTVPNQGNIRISDNYTTYSLPYAEIKNTHYPFKNHTSNWWSYTTYGGSTPARTFMTANTTYDPRATLRFQEIQTLLMAYLTMQVPHDWLDLGVPWNETKPVTTECALYLCTNEYQPKSQGSILQESITGSWADRDPHSFQLSRSTDNKASAWDHEQGNKLYEPIVSLEKHDLRLLIPEKAVNPQISIRDVNVTQTFIQALIESLITFRGANPALNQQNFSLIAFPDAAAPAMMDALWNSTNITATFENVARSITNHIRSASPDRHFGTTQSWVLYVHVEWVYLAYPISMLVIGMAYVICTIVESIRLRMPAWKEGVLPTLLYGFDDEAQGLLRQQAENKKSQMDDIRVRFDFDEKANGRRLIAN